jgi:hypothetical protein
MWKALDCTQSHFEMHIPLLDFGEMKQEVSLDNTTAPEDFAGRGEELFVTEGHERGIGVHHEPIVAPRFLRLVRGPQMHFVPSAGVCAVFPPRAHLEASAAA